MSDPDRDEPDDAEGGPELPADEEFVRSYAAGYAEGVRSALREILQHTSRGHTAQELRILAESRLARLADEVELKRKSLLAPPRRPAWSALLRAPAPPRPGGPTLGGSLLAGPRLEPGESRLVREERPERGPELVRASWPGFPRTVVVSLRPPDLGPVPADRRVEIAVAGPGGAGALSPGQLGGRLRDPTEASGGALVYLDALEYLITEYSFETTLRFVNWLVGQVTQTRSALVVSFDRRSLEMREMSRLERAFGTLA
ncbi:MAG TPA: DUF835 domain-containing protein [Thermoplasmata archaeon]|nr:DUF835 domain-containing protein [Thermoplasmata archaeon]